MKNKYKMTVALLAGFFGIHHAEAQTHYGQGVGTLGAGHVFIGTNAGQSNTSSALYNTYIGYDAGKGNAAGGGNVFLGSFSGQKSQNGVNNVFLGNSAGREHSNGESNVLIGPNAGYGVSGSLNIAIGREAGFSTTGSENTFLGDAVALENTTGSFNAFIGAKAGDNNGAGNNNAFFGYKTGYYSHGNNNVFMGYQAGFENDGGQLNTYLGSSAGGNANLQNATAIGANAKVTASNSIVLGKNANVGIGVSAPFFQLQLSTSLAAKAGSGMWTVASDSRLKNNISSFTDGLDFLKQIKPVWFQYNGKAGIETGDKKFVGIIAREMQKIAPYTISTFIHQDSLGNKTEYLDYDANAITYILINSVKEQQQVIEQKDAELKEVKTEVAALSTRLEQLERIIASNNAKPLTGNVARTDPNANGAVLEQNIPNGFSENSRINYFIPESVKEAVIDVYSVYGVKVNSYQIKERGEGKLTISAEGFQNGVFLYDLVTDGKSNGVKKMVVQK